MNKIIGLITDLVHPSLIDLLSREGYEFDYLPDIKSDELIKIISNYDYVIVRGRTRLDEDILNKAGRLKVIIRYGVGLDNIDVEAARRNGIKVFNTPSSFTEAVAELTLGLILGVLRNLGEAHRSMREGKWEKKRFIGYELLGKTVAILGFGRIGRRVADLLQPFNVKIIAYDILPIPEKYINKGVISAKNIEDAVREADIITIHMPLTKNTRHIINYDLFKKMKHKPFIINTARGGIIKEEDLVRAIKEGLVRGAALDVFSEEPPHEKELLTLDNLFLTPHIGGQTMEARERAALEVLKILKNEFG